MKVEARRSWSRAGAAFAALTLWGVAAASMVSGQTGETAGLITELKPGTGRVEIKSAGTGDWRPARPLTTLRAGDEVRAGGGASAVIVLSNGRGSVKVEAANSPFVVAGGQPAERRSQKARALLDASLGFLSAGARESSQVTLATRSGIKPPVIITPRNGPVLPGSLAFEWSGSRFARARIAISGPGGVVLERTAVTGGRFDYPSDAPPLASRVRYTFQVKSGNQPPQEAWFEVVDPERAQAIRRDLEALAEGVDAASSLAALKGAFLAQQGLIHDARLTVIHALTKDPEEPVLHLLLGKLYASQGLAHLAAEAYDEAEALVKRDSLPLPKK